MKQSLFKWVPCIVFLASWGLLAYGQISSSSSLSGSVTDPSGAVVPGAVITVKNVATDEEFRTATTDNGTFTVPALSAGTYVVTVTAKGFRQAVVTDVKVDVATPASFAIALEVGAETQSVMVEAGGLLLQTQSANISTTIVGRQLRSYR